MSRHFAFLRAINVGGHTVTMAALRTHFEALGATDVETFIASGNVVFESRARDAAALERRIETHLESALGYEVATFLRSGDELIAVAAEPAFDAKRRAAARAFNVAFLKVPLTAAQKRALKGMETEVDALEAHGRELYWLCRVRQSESTFANARLERTLGISATFRGMNTVKRMVARFVA